MGNWQTIYLDTVDSTNNEVKRRADRGAPHGLAVVAGEQTAGRGRLGRSFQSPCGKGLYLTVLLRPALSPAQVTGLTAWTAVAVCDAVQAAFALRPRIKWTNDIILDGKKLCGILVETKAEGERLAYAAVGIGINANQTPEDFDPQVRPVAGSLAMALGRSVEPAGLVPYVLQALGRMYDEFPDRHAQWLARYRADCLSIGREVALVRGGRVRYAYAEDVGDDFSLLVRYPDGTREAVRSGEVSVRGLLGYI
jgi:BirA family biotin operon repressor/biotin-[acetyl-CoA-carboxylase] ligase